MTQPAALKAAQPLEESLTDQPQGLLSHLVEWQRVELLCICLLNAKEGPGEELLADLKQAQHAVMQWRQGDFWQPLGLEQDLLAQDLFACVVAPQVLPRIGWLYQNLQNSAQPAPTEALLISLLALPDELLDQARQTLWRLEARGLIKRDSPDPFAPIALTR